MSHRTASPHRQTSIRRNVIVMRFLAIVLVAVTGATIHPWSSAQALTPGPEDVVAYLSSDDGAITIGWPSQGSDTTIYPIRWTSGGATFYTRLKPIGECDSDGSNCFDPGASRHYFTLPSTDPTIEQVGVRAIDGSGDKSDWTDVAVTNGQPVSIELAQSGSSLRVSWSDPFQGAEPITRYALKYRVVGRSAAEYISVKPTDGVLDESVEIPTNGDQIEVQLRTVFDNLAKTSFTEWYTLAPDSITDLRDECRPGGAVYQEIGATGTYPEDRIPMESQVWFFPTDESEGGEDTGQSFGHAHLTTCVPHQMSGDSDVVRSQTLNLDIRIQAHLQAASHLDKATQIKSPPAGTKVRVPMVEIRGKTNNRKDVLVDQLTADDGYLLECEVGSAEPCVTQVRFAVDLHNSEAAQEARANPSPNNEFKWGFTSNGSKQLRVAAIHEVVVSGQKVAQMRAIIRSPFDFELADSPNGDWFDPVDVRTNDPESSGWLIQSSKDGAGGYATVGLRNPIQTSPVPTDRDWELDLHVEADPCVTNCAVDRMPILRYHGFIDPAFHGPAPCPDRGDGADPVTGCRAFTGAVGATLLDGKVSVPAEALAGLEPGVHRLVLAAEQPMVDSDEYNIAQEWESTLTGLLVLRFVVE